MKLLRTLIFSGLLIPSMALAIGIESPGYRLDINAYFDFEAEYMSMMPVVEACTSSSPCVVGPTSYTQGNRVEDMHSMILPDQNRLNLVLTGKSERLTTRINLEGRHSYTSTQLGTGSSEDPAASSGATTLGSLRFAEVYADYRFTPGFGVRVGNFLTPFGLFNQIRYLTPLFATVVLPFAYETPFNYNRAPVFPSNASVMAHGKAALTDLFGLQYYAYVGAGRRNSNDASEIDAGVGREANNDKALGARIVLSATHDYLLGLSSYTVRETGENREFTLGLDLDLRLPGSLRFQFDGFQLTGNDEMKVALHTRLMHQEIESRWVPYLSFDSFRDGRHSLYNKAQNRLGVGSMISLNEYVTLKGEYHYHFWSELPSVTAVTADGLTTLETKPGSNTNHMVKLAVIFLL